METSQPVGTVVQLMQLLSGTFAGKTWAAWRAVLKAAFALDLTAAERVTVAALTDRETLPSRPVRELWLFIGRRSGKSIIAALQAVWATCCRSYQLAAGEIGIFMVLASDRRQARVIKKYISGFLHAHPSLEALIANETAEAIELTNNLVIEIHTCSFRSLRGYTCIGAAVDEVAFWQSDDAANPDREVLVALRAAMASQPAAMLVGLTSVYSRRGEVWRIYEKYFGNNDAPNVLVVNGSTTSLNPTISQSLIDAAYADDPIAAAAEFGGEFRRDVVGFVDREVVEACTMTGRHELPPSAGTKYHAFTDPSGGSNCSFTLAIAHRGRDKHVVIDAVREVTPPFSPDTVVGDFAQLLGTYGVTTIYSDRYAGQWPVERWRVNGITCRPAKKTASELLRDMLPLLNSGRLELLDHPRTVAQLLALERRTSSSGRELISHPPRGFDDLIVSVAGVSDLVSGTGLGTLVSLIGVRDHASPASHALQAVRRQKRQAALLQDVPAHKGEHAC